MLRCSRQGHHGRDPFMEQSDSRIVLFQRIWIPRTEMVTSSPASRILYVYFLYGGCLYHHLEEATIEFTPYKGGTQNRKQIRSIRNKTNKGKKVVNRGILDPYWYGYGHVWWYRWYVFGNLSSSNEPNTSR